MKKYLLAILMSTMLFVAPTHSWMMMGANQPSDGATPCETAGCTGTFEHCWTGQYASDTDKACQESGASTSDGTENGSPIQDSGGGDYVAQIYDADDYIVWTDIPDQSIDAKGTVEFELTTPGSFSGETCLFEIWDDSNNIITCKTRSTEPDIQCRHKGQSTSRYVDSGAISTSTTYTIVFSWRNDSTERLSLSVDASESTNDADINAFSSDINEIVIGDKRANFGVADDMVIDDFEVRTGYEGS